MPFTYRSRRLAMLALFAVLITVVPVRQAAVQASPQASPGSAPTSVTIAGDFQSELGCPEDWRADCSTTHLLYDATDDVWQATFNLPAGDWQYKATIDDSWDENYGLHAIPGGPNIQFHLDTPTDVKFYFDNKSHWVTDNVSTVIAVAPGSFQSALGCPGDWQADCLRSWLQDIDGDGIYTLETTAIPAGNYEAKVALNETWDVNYGQGGEQNGPNIPFTVTAGALVRFSFDSVSHVPTITVVPRGHSHDNNVEWNGLRFDSRDTLYRSPTGAVPAGTPVMVRFRTFHDDVTAVRLRVYDLNASAQTIYNMNQVASGVSCYQQDLAGDTCDFWSYMLNSAQPDNLWYRFIVTDGADTDYYADNTPALDGGLGAATDDLVDQSYALMFYDPAFNTPSWTRNAVVYQIFPDRFRNGRTDNDPQTGDVRYDEPVIKLPWGTLPEGYCKNYAGFNALLCPWRFGQPPQSNDALETPQGRDYFGGDLKGVDQQLDYLQSLGVNTIYFNPIFDSGSNHGYDTQSYMKIDPYFGTQKDWENLVKHAQQRGMRLVLDGVFNHMSSDSPFFDRYHHYATVGACEAADSPYRQWFHFRAPTGNEPSPCAPSTPGGTDTYYDGWFGFDSIPVLNKSLPDVQSYFVNGSNSVSAYWLKQGAGGWRLDVMGDASFPNGYWETFRNTVKQTDPNAVIIGELWQKDSTLLRYLRGDRADSTMNYRFRDAVLGLLAVSPFDPKGFADSGRTITPTEFASRLMSIREDYPDAAYYSMLNLLDSHDTARLLWALTEGANTPVDKQDPVKMAAGKQRVKLASLIQFTIPGMPTVYYGDEAGMTGSDDPDDRRTYPWSDLGGSPDQAMLAHYQTLSQKRSSIPALVSGDIRVLETNDGDGTVAYGRKTGSQVAVVAINRSDTAHTVTVPVTGYLPDGVALSRSYLVGTSSTGSATVTNGVLTVSLGPSSGILLASDNNVDLTPPAAPANLTAADSSSQVDLSWDAVPGAAGYNVYRGPLSGGGYAKVNTSPVTTTSFTDDNLTNGQTYYYVVKALDAAGNESMASNEVAGLPHYVIGWANLQWPSTVAHTISAVNRTDNVYGQVWIDGVTNQPGQAPTLRAQLGYGPQNSNPAGNPAWIWLDASFNGDRGNNDEFVASMLPEEVGSYDYAYRYTTTNGRDWLYADLDGTGNGYDPAQAGKMTVSPSGDTTAPAVPTGLRVTDHSSAGISLAWDAVTNDPTMYGYEVLRSDTPGGPYTQIARVEGENATTYSDADVQEGATYYYVVRSLDTSFNRSGYSSEVSGVAALRTVTVVFNVTVPSTTDATGYQVHIAGTLSRLDGGHPDWDPGAVALTRVDATHWTITLTGQESTQIEYKYALGSWTYVEKDASCGEIGNRQLTLSYGANGTQTVNDTVQNWRNVSPCGD